jgi:hypothetical protein
VEEEEQSFSNRRGDVAKVFHGDGTTQLWLQMINNLPTTWVEKFKGP